MLLRKLLLSSPGQPHIFVKQSIIYFRTLASSASNKTSYLSLRWPTAPLQTLRRPTQKEWKILSWAYPVPEDGFQHKAYTHLLACQLSLSWENSESKVYECTVRWVRRQWASWIHKQVKDFWLTVAGFVFCRISFSAEETLRSPPARPTSGKCSLLGTGGSGLG